MTSQSFLKLTNHDIVFPFDFVIEHCPRADSGEQVRDHRLSFAISNKIVMSGHEVKTDVIFLAVQDEKEKLLLNSCLTHLAYHFRSPSIDTESGHNKARVSALLTDINLLLYATRIRFPLFHHMCRVNSDFGVKVGCVDPNARVIVRKCAFGGHDFGFERHEFETLRSFLGRAQRVALGGDGHGQVDIVVSVCQLHGKDGNSTQVITRALQKP